MKRYVKCASGMSDDTIKKIVSTRVLTGIHDYGREAALRRILFDKNNTIDWQAAWAAIAEQMPEVEHEVSKITSSTVTAADAMNPGWSKRYNSETDETYYVLAIPKRTATVTYFDDGSDFGYIARVICKDTGSQKHKTFRGSDSQDKAMTWCEKLIYNEK